MKRFFLFIAVAALMMSGSQQASAKVTKAQYKAYEEALLSIIKRANLPSIQLVYVTPEDSLSFAVVNKDFYENTKLPQEVQPISDKSIYQACSISKIPLSWIAVKMIDEGSLELDKPLVEYYPDIVKKFKTEQDKEWAKMLTPRICMIHRTGLPNKGYVKMTFDCKPDTKYGYSGPGIYALQMTIEHIKGKSLMELSREYIFDPLGMKHTNYAWVDEYEQTHVNGYKKDTVTRNKWDKGKPGSAAGRKPNAAYSMRTSAAEYTVFLRAMMHHWGMSEKAYEMMLQPYGDPIPAFYPERGNFYRALGLCCAMDTEFGPAFWHYGDNGNFKGMSFFFPEKDITLVGFINSVNSYAIYDPIINLFLKPEKPLVFGKNGKKPLPAE